MYPTGLRRMEYQFYQLKPAVCCLNSNGLSNNMGKMHLIQYPDHLRVQFQLQNLQPGPYTLGLHQFGDERSGYNNLGLAHPTFDLGKIIVGPTGTYQVSNNYSYPLDQLIGRSLVLRSGLTGQNLGYGIVGHSSMPVYV